MSDTNPFASLDVATVINAAGKMTALGGSAQSAAVAAAQAAAARAHVDLAALRAAAGRRVASLCGAEAGCITTGAAAGICISVAAVLTGTDRARVAQVPDLPDGPREVLLQAGHDVFFGAAVTQMIRLGGGVPVLAGSRERVTIDDVRARLGVDSACLMFIQSHHCLQEDRLTLEDMAALARERRLPLLVDAAAEEDLRRYVAAGADLVSYSGGKAIGGPTSGFIVGREDLIAACELQQIGIARPMKVGKEQIMGLMAALDAYPGAPVWHEVLEALVEALSALPGIRVSRVPDRAGRAIARAGVAPVAGNFEPVELVRHLQDGSPSIRTRNHQLGEGLVLFDPRELRLDQVPVICARVAEFCRHIGGASEPPGA
ncbi:MAG: hypothetical protein R3E86_04765 [Pseudomonadales bacterium]